MRLIAAAGLVLALTAAPAGAQSDEPAPADVPVTELQVGGVRADSQARHFEVPVTCVSPTGTAGACVLTLEVSWQRTPKTEWAPSGERHAVDQQQLTIPAGATQTVVSDVAPAKLRDVLSAADGAAIVTFSFSDPAGPVDSAAVFVRPPSRKGGCGGATFIDVLSGALQERADVDGKESWTALHSTQIARSTSYKVTSGTARVRYSGLVVTAHRGAIFSVGCGGLSDYNRGRFFPLVHLESGTLRVKGRPRGEGSFAAAVSTLEGNLGMRRRERADLIVTRKAKRFVSTMHVRRGRSGQITPTFHTAKSSPCTSGSKLKVNLRGKITRVR